MRRRVLFVMLILGLPLLVSESRAYEEIRVEKGGTLTGVVTLNGDVPRPKGYNLVTFPDAVYCGRISDGFGWRLLQPFNVGSENGFKDVVVLIKDIKKGKPFQYTPQRIEAVDCKFNPYITIVRDKHNVEIVNMDPVMHDIQAYETSHLGARVLFNLPLPVSDRMQRRKKDLLAGKHVKNRVGKILIQKIKMRRGRDIFVMQCGFHAYMESWGLAVKNPYYALSGTDGRYTISDVPPGTYKVIAWHPMITKEFEVTIEENQTHELNIEIDAPKGRLYANEALDGTRFGIELLGGSKIVPIVEHQKR